nr:YhbY family RNA-binding protein [uncultured Peptostreptococcus sp.]
MLNGKKRAYLRSLANTTKPTSQIGKEGLTQDFLEQLEDQLRVRELVKVTILDNAGLDAKDTANAICEAIRAEFVQAIGSKFTIYKKNNENPKIIFPGHQQAKPKDKRENTSKRITKKQASIRSIKKK